jgi:hypothetical protein
MSQILDDLMASLDGLPEAERKALYERAAVATHGYKWLPSPGAQTRAYFCPADILLYGGMGGGGKSDLGLGLAFTAHKRSLVLRRKYANLSALTERAIEINGTRSGYNGSPPPLLRTEDGRYIQFAGNQHLGDEQDWQGHPFDLKVFDEATQFLELQVRFHLGWLRTTDPSQRVRALLATNPPVDAEGDWIIGVFRPWLDITHGNPAKHGELRWYVTAPDGSDLEVEGPDPVQLPGSAGPSIPMSRTFIPASLKDNPYLINSGYQAKLDGLPEPIRSAVRDGNFMAARADADFQVIPTQWVINAEARWLQQQPEGIQMTAMAVDIAQGGSDRTVLAMRYGGYYLKPVAVNGSDTPDGSSVAALVVKHRRDNCPVIVDMGGGYGGDTLSRLKDNGIDCHRFNAANKSTSAAQDGSKLTFRNKRAEAWWRFREALNPDQEGGSKIAIPHDPDLRADLCAPTWSLGSSGILIESKDDIRKRLGRSTDKGDAVVMALSQGEIAVKKRQKAWTERPSTANLGYASLKRKPR